MAKRTYGKTASGVPITEKLVGELAGKADAGYDVGATLRRRGGRPPIGSAAASVESVRLDPELRDALARRAQHDKERPPRLSARPDASISTWPNLIWRRPPLVDAGEESLRITAASAASSSPTTATPESDVRGDVAAARPPTAAGPRRRAAGTLCPESLPRGFSTETLTRGKGSKVVPPPPDRCVSG